MVWFVNCYTSKFGKRKPHDRFQVREDNMPQTINVMFNLCKPCDPIDLNTLFSCGVNIFNVDLTIHDKKFLKNVIESIEALKNENFVYPYRYYRPVSLAVTMFPTETVIPSEHVQTDFIILKHVKTPEEVREFGKRNVGIKSISIIPWIRELEIEATNELIKISDGVILDLNKEKFNESHYLCLRKYFEAFKPVFYLEPNLVRDYDERFCNDRKIMIISEFLIDQRFDGVVLFDCNEPVYPEYAVQSLVKATKFAVDHVDYELDYLKLSYNGMKPPLLPPIGTALSASLAAIKTEASLILVLTASGNSARIVSFTSPPCSIIAVTTKKTSARRMHLYKKVLPLLYKEERAKSWREECRNRIDFGTNFALNVGLLRAGAKLVILAPSEERIGYCDSFQIINVPYVCDD